MHADHQDGVLVQVQFTVVKLQFGVIVVGKLFAFKPAEQSPLGRCHAAWQSTFNRIGDFFVLANDISRFGAFER